MDLIAETVVNTARKTKLNNRKSFYDWCKENDRYDVIERWDYEMNNCSPEDVHYSGKGKYWFKCDKHPEHKSEPKRISNFVKGSNGVMYCKQCNSIAKYLLDKFPDKNLSEIWDYNKNKDLDPWEISRGSNKKIWIKCQEKDYHGSYEITGHRILRGDGCPYCSCKNKKIHHKDSFGQYIVDEYGEDFLHSIWSDKNKISPFQIGNNTTKKVWWKCIDEKHKDYYRSVYNSILCEFRCPCCVKEKTESIIELKTREYLEELGYCVLHEHRCSLVPINPKTKCPMPYDNEIVVCDKHVIIEVHGRQHYTFNYYKIDANCTDHDAIKKLKKRKLYDRYKKYIAWKNGYEYLEIPYTAYVGENKELYKQMINEKIEEVLNDAKAV